MLDLKELAKNFDAAAARLATRGGALDLSRFQALFAQRKALIVQVEGDQSKRNKAADDMAKASAEEKKAKGPELKALSNAIKEGETALKAVEDELTELMLHLPNVPHGDVPTGASEHDNQVVRTSGQKPALPFTPKQHFELGEGLGLLDFERAAKVSGSRFAFLAGDLARLERALCAFMIDRHTAKGYLELSPPYLVSRAAMMGTGQLPKFEVDAFKTAGEHELFLIPTAEVPVTNFHADEILENLPKKYCAYSPCFRAEAGSAGKDTRGLIRMHQFHKVEIVQFVRPSESMAALEELTQDACGILEALGLHYRVVLLCTGDMGFASQKTYDLEVWLPGQNAFREISSCSNFGDFQARRAKIRFRDKREDKPQLLHTLNGSGLAIGRTLVALLENYQREDGSVRLPEVLGPYMGGRLELKPAKAVAGHEKVR
jgi:seryl-tRNA synthetase